MHRAFSRFALLLILPTFLHLLYFALLRRGFPYAASPRTLADCAPAASEARTSQGAAAPAPADAAVASTVAAGGEAGVSGATAGVAETEAGRSRAASASVSALVGAGGTGGRAGGADGARRPGVRSRSKRSIRSSDALGQREWRRAMCGGRADRRAKRGGERRGGRENGKSIQAASGTCANPSPLPLLHHFLHPIHKGSCALAPPATPVRRRT